MDHVQALLRRCAAEGVPVEHVALGNLDDRRTWTVKCPPEHEATVRRIIETYDPADPADARALIRKELDESKLLKAVALWAAGHLNITPETARAQILEIRERL